MVIIIMGVSGSGKTTVGQALAEKLSWEFEDADSYHPKANVDKMKRGEPLTDEDRAGWFLSLRDLIGVRSGGKRNLVLACSALKRAYRAMLAGGDSDLWFVHLKGDRELIAERLSLRKDHFMNPKLLESQFAALEEPDADEGKILVVEIGQAVPRMVEEIIENTGLGRDAGEDF